MYLHVLGFDRHLVSSTTSHEYDRTLSRNEEEKPFHSSVALERRIDLSDRETREKSIGQTRGQIKFGQLDWPTTTGQMETHKKH